MADDDLLMDQNDERMKREYAAMLKIELFGLARIRHREIVWSNGGLERILGYEMGGVVGLVSRSLYPDEASFEALGAAAYPGLAEGGTYRTQLTMLKKNGGRIWVDLTALTQDPVTGESLWLFGDISQSKVQQDQIEHAAYHDVLTGLPNRLLLVDRMRQARAHAIRSRRAVVICCLDLDGFKTINDSYGYAAGDVVLKEVARRLQAKVREHDSVCRLGGDTFLLLLGDLAQPYDQEGILQRLLESVSEPIRIRPDCDVQLCASIGVTLYQNDDRDTETVLQRAQRALARAKVLVGNHIVFDFAESQADAC